MTQTLSLLLVDPDPAGLEILTFGFEREGASVNATSDMVAAPKLVDAAEPSLVVVVLHPSEPSALDVIRRLRTGGYAIPHVAVLALGPADQREAARAAGASEFLAMPTFIRDVVNAGKLAMVGRRASGQDLPSTEARLADYRGTYYLLRAMAATGCSAMVRLERGNRRAELRVSEGRLLSANVESLQSLPALHHALLWEQASVSIKLGPVGKRNQLNLSAQEVLDESERFLRDFGHAARDLGPSTTIYAATSSGGATPGLQSSQAAPLLRLCDGHRNLADVIAESPFRIFDTLRMIKRLRDSGALAGRAPAPVSDHAASSNGASSSMLGEWAMVPDLRGVVGDRRGPGRQLRAAANLAHANPTGTPVARAAAEPAILAHRQGTSTAGEIVPEGRPTPAASLAVAPTVQVKVDVDGTPLSEPVAVGSSAPAPVPVARTTGQRTPIALRTRADQAARSRLDATPAPELQRPTTGPQARLEHEPPVRGTRSPSGPQPRLDRTPPPRANKAPSGPQPRLDRTPPPRANKAPSGSQARLDRTPPPRANKAPSGPQPTVANAFDDVEADFFAREADLYKRDALETFDDLDHPLGRTPGKPRARKK